MVRFLLVALCATPACGDRGSADAPPGSGGTPPGAGGAAHGNGGAMVPPGPGGSAGAGATPEAGGTAGAGGTPAPAGGAGGTIPAGGAGGDVSTTGGAGGDVPTGGAGGGPPVFDPGTAPDRNRVAAGAVCERLSVLQCAGEAFCCSAPGRTVDACRQAMKDFCVTQLYLDAISTNPVAAYSVDRAETAFTEFERLASQCDPAITAFAVSTTGLRGIVTGTVDAGGNCTAPNVFDRNAAAGYLAACRNPDTTACLPSLTTWTCKPRSQAGGACFTDVNCVDGVYCDNPNLNPTGAKCAPRKGDGQSCGTPNECASLLCKGGLCVGPSGEAAYCLGG